MLFNFLNIMKKNKEDKGVLAKDMKLPELQQVALGYGLFTKEDVLLMKKPALLKAINAKEQEILNDPNREGLKRVVTEGQEPVAETVTVSVEMHNGKKVIRKTPVEHNGKNYMDILVETGETYRELIG